MEEKELRIFIEKNIDTKIQFQKENEFWDFIKKYKLQYRKSKAYIYATIELDGKKIIIILEKWRSKRNHNFIKWERGYIYAVSDYNINSIKNKIWEFLKTEEKYKELLNDLETLLTFIKNDVMV